MPPEIDAGPPPDLYPMLAAWWAGIAPDTRQVIVLLARALVWAVCGLAVGNRRAR